MKAPLTLPFLAALLLVASPLFAQTNTTDESIHPLADPDYWHNYPHGLANIVTAPSHWDAEQWRTFAVIAGVTGGLFLADETIRDWVQDDLRNGTTNKMADLARPFGSNAVVAVGSLALAGAGAIMDNRHTEETGLLSLQGLLLSNVTLEGLKLLTHRHRPDESPNDAHQWDGPGLHSGYKSFASGHSAKAFMLASVIASQYPDNKPLQIASYGIAGLTALSRVNDDRHWASDVVAGAAIGYSIGKLVTSMSPFQSDGRISLTPIQEGDSNGLALNYRF
jgi:membrane-associated phospholipid phosphatase